MNLRTTSSDLYRLQRTIDRLQEEIPSLEELLARRQQQLTAAKTNHQLLLNQLETAHERGELVVQHFAHIWLSLPYNPNLIRGAVHMAVAGIVDRATWSNGELILRFDRERKENPQMMSLELGRLAKNVQFDWTKDYLLFPLVGPLATNLTFFKHCGAGSAGVAIENEHFTLSRCDCHRLVSPDITGETPAPLTYIIGESEITSWARLNGYVKDIECLRLRLEDSISLIGKRWVH